ncbi:hypothetical protein HG531_006937 [Fusarium graminearum]|nr:hypothetical protein HG531_006937 [Fusarium graminearum]
MSEVEDLVVQRCCCRELERITNRSPLVRKMVNVRDDPLVFEHHLRTLPLGAIRSSVPGWEVFKHKDLGAKFSNRWQGGSSAVVVEPVSKRVFVEGILKRQGVVVSNATTFLLEAHNNSLGWIPVQEIIHVADDILKAESSVAVGMVDVQLIVAHTSADVKVAKTRFQLHCQVPVLALQDLCFYIVGHGIVRSWYAEAREIHIIGDLSHPSWVVS